MAAQQTLRIFSEISKNQAHKIQLSNVHSTFLAMLASAIADEKKQHVLMVAADLNSAEKLRDDIEILRPDRFGFFPADELIPFDEKEANPAMVSLRLETLEKLAKIERMVVVTTAQALCKKVISKERFHKNRIELDVGQEYLFELLQEELQYFGFQRVDTVERIGTYSIRGGLIDVYPWVADDPIRIEFFGDEIESMRSFDLVTQRSIATIDRIELFPNTPEDERVASLLEHMAEPVLVLPDIDVCLERLQHYQDDALHTLENRGKDAAEFSNHYFSAAETAEQFESLRQIVTSLHKKDGAVAINANALPKYQFQGDFGRFMGRYKHNVQDGVRTLIRCEHETQKERLFELFEDHEMPAPEVEIGAFHFGLSLLDEKFEMINEHEIFNRFKRNKPYKKFKRAEALRSLNMLTYNDYVVHVDYGVGQFKGLRKINISNAEKETLLLEYENGDNVYVGIDKINKVQKFSSDEGAEPKKTKIGGKEWDRLKAKTRKQVETIAKELVELYAERSLSNGFKFSPDTKWQHELEASFDYQDTADQITATEDVKADMESAKPMDRLVCGDVGFGKTEIAIRAAFKAVMDSKQVAVLVPTTILASQHYENFRDRMANFPVKVELLSRFRTAKDQKAVVERLKTGDVDIVIGTHRLTSQDIQFKDLGLLIVDEEQRFGVKHKERLKDMRKGVDILTLTATPIPRTLQQSLVGVRGISNIETPPINRLPVITEIISWDDEIIYTAVMREMERGGQIYVVHNRIQTIEQIRDMIHKVAPKARIIIGHGQMNERELETVMHDFKEGKYDILLATMIIENGLDIPNVNTILINHAERFGLAQLYQLRGRVGRSQRQAYAYMITPQMNRMTETAIKRLYALEEFSELGSGIKISMRDLEIRGAGSLLGHQQSGHINAVGYELYLDILEEAIAELKEQIDESAGDIVRQKKIETQFDVDLDALLPDSYVSNARERMTLYHRLSQCENETELIDVEAELVDRFGVLPAAVSNLVNMLRIRNEANKLGAEKVDVKSNVMILKFAEILSEKEGFVPDMIKFFLSQQHAEINFIDNKGFGVKVYLKADSRSSDKIIFAMEFLKKINAAKSPSA